MEQGKHPNSLANLKPGSPSNLGGVRPSATKEAKALVKYTSQHAEAIIDNLVEIALDTSTPLPQRVKASIYLLDRCMGKPSKSIDVNATASGTVDYRRMSTSELERIVAEEYGDRFIDEE